MRAVVGAHFFAECRHSISELAEKAEYLALLRVTWPDVERIRAAAERALHRRAFRSEAGADRAHDGLEMIEHGPLPTRRRVLRHEELAGGVEVFSIGAR